MGRVPESIRSDGNVCVKGVKNPYLWIKPANASDAKEEA